MCNKLVGWTWQTHTRKDAVIYAAVLDRPRKFRGKINYGKEMRCLSRGNEICKQLRDVLHGEKQIILHGRI